MWYRRQHLALGVLLTAIMFVTAAVDAIAAPKRPIAPKPSAAERSPLSSISWFFTYDVGTLRMSGKSAKDVTYNGGTLQFTGRTPGSTIYKVGTLGFIGAAMQTATYSVGTISMSGKRER
jgi:hypothetical protein